MYVAAPHIFSASIFCALPAASTPKILHICSLHSAYELKSTRRCFYCHVFEGQLIEQHMLTDSLAISAKCASACLSLPPDEVARLQKPHNLINRLGTPYKEHRKSLAQV